MASVYRKRLQKLRIIMHKRGIRALYINSPTNLRYLTGHTTGQALIGPDFAKLWVKDVYLDLYSKTFDERTYPFEVCELMGDTPGEYIKKLRLMRIHVESGESAYNLGNRLGKTFLVTDIMRVLRAVKSKEELRLIRHSCNIAKIGIEAARKSVKVGVYELDAVGDIQAKMYKAGSEKPSFGQGLLLASGKDSADIHASASPKKIISGPVVVDLGAVFGGYHSDTTRTLVAGRLTKLQTHVMEFVENLKDETIDMIRPGMKASSVHGFVNERIEKAGYKFYHLSGHGVGLEIHEYPNFKPGVDFRLKKDMVFTVEPGIYIPHKFGVRFEDTLVLGSKGCKRLT